jgi:hypothetical protein
MAFDPTKPAANSPVSSVELRNQFTGLQTNIQAKASEDDCLNRLSTTARNPTALSGMGMVVSDPPTQAEVQAISNQLDSLLDLLKRP